MRYYGIFQRVAGLALLTALTVGWPGVARADFAAWLAEFKQTALAEGISQATIDRALVGLSPIERVIELDRRQPEGRVSYTRYLERAVNGQRIEAGRDRMARHAELLNRIGQDFGVDPRFIVALWGMETDYGSFIGGFPVIGALATLAYEGRREAFFRRELLHALRILESGDVSPDRMKGSWAGAMGQAQFMPTSFDAYAVDYDGDGRRDIWDTPADIFASIANYLREADWQYGLSWGVPVALPSDFDRDLVSLEVLKPLAEWQQLGMRLVDDSAPLDGAPMSLVAPGGADGPTFLVSDNFRAIMRWNRSAYFATAVGHLADAIGKL